MPMAVIEINWKPSAKQLRQFSAVEIVFFAIVSAWLYYNTSSFQVAVTVFVVAVVVGVLGLIWPAFVRPVYMVWMAIAFPIGWLVSHLLLAVLFYLAISPIGIIMRLCGYDAMQRKFDPQAETYWKRREPNDDPERYFKQF
jgi:hypothetical protein